MASRYQIGAYLKQMGTILDLSPERVLRRVGLSATLANDEDISVTAEVYFRFWEAMRLEANRPGIEMDLAMAYAHGPFIPAIFAFSCAETLGLGLSRLSDFKPLIGPMAMNVEQQGEQLVVSVQSSEAGLSVPPSLGVFELLYITECARTFTGTPVTPVATTLPGPFELNAASLDFLGAAPKHSGITSLTFSAEDAALPLITQSASLWETLEPNFIKQLAQRATTETMSGRIRRALTEALPGGAASADDIARRLNVSKRSLQRRLSEEGTSFQDVLNETRLQMAQHYLKDSDLSLPEISYLLGFRETSSFFRAFQSWTGQTPGDFRASDGD